MQREQRRLMAKRAVLNMDALNSVKQHVGVLALAGAGAYMVKTVLDKIRNDIKCQSLIDDLMLNDQVIKTLDKETALRWYATIYTYAPNLARDKETVREVMRNFVRFGKVDLQTLKTLADTEKTISATKKEQFDVPKFLGIIR